MFACLRSSAKLKKISKIGFFRNRDSQNLENFVEAHVQPQLLLDDGHQNIDREGNPDLRLHCVLGGTIEGLDPQMLFDPAEEQLHLPPGSIQLGDGERREQKGVGQEGQARAR